MELEQWNNGTMEQWKNNGTGTMEQWNNGTMEKWKNGRMELEQWNSNNVTMQ